MRALAVAWLVLSLVALVPTATACSFAVASAFSEVAWPADDVLATNRAYEAGLFRPATGRFEGIGLAAVDSAFALSPDVRWFATAQGLYRDAPVASSASDTCGFPYSLVHAKDLGTGEAVLVSEKGAGALAASSDYLALAQGRTISFRALGTFDEARSIDVRAPFEDASSHLRALRFTPRGLLVATAQHLAVVLDPESGEEVARFESHRYGGVAAAALDEDTGRFAVAGDRPLDALGSRHESFVVVLDREGNALAEWSREQRTEGALSVRSLQWTDGGLAAGAAPFVPGASSPPRARVVLFDDAMREVAQWEAPHAEAFALAASPDGSRLAVGGVGTLAILEAGTLREEGAWTLSTAGARMPVDNETAVRAEPFFEQSRIVRAGDAGDAGSGFEIPSAGVAAGLAVGLAAAGLLPPRRPRCA